MNTQCSSKVQYPMLDCRRCRSTTCNEGTDGRSLYMTTSAQKRETMSNDKSSQLRCCCRNALRMTSGLGGHPWEEKFRTRHPHARPKPF
jgi:hypothetical protein